MLPEAVRYDLHDALAGEDHQENVLHFFLREGRRNVRRGYTLLSKALFGEEGGAKFKAKEGGGGKVSEREFVRGH